MRGTKAITVIGNSNPAGIVIEDAWLAFGAAYFSDDLTVDEAIARICGPLQRPRKPDANVSKTQKHERIITTYADHPDYNNAQIARATGCSRELVRQVLDSKGYRLSKKRKIS